MKNGDRLLCKKDFEFYPDGIFYRGNFYDVQKVEGHNIRIGCVISGNDFWFNYTKVYGDSMLVYDYFYTEKEMRKMKLEKINGNNN